ncbi:Fic family protein [Aureibacter tunicatorum]|uniref:Fic family protein n=1 Tax=Aureibacter tunicatorum TaxID=866807 RepID=A0AAE3XTY2_9BACT|nr:Fic family protein [Aureibacter tunicatorum]MDR6241935.1 Fic family protein [Aureibacter tunicatorum]BDD07542.1 adenosine monophosphate-protein transferase [Aureibacter tunicatorum]
MGKLNTKWQPMNLPYQEIKESMKVYKALIPAHRALAELKASSRNIPNEEILINTLSIQEAKDSSEVENIVTTHDDIFKESLNIDSYVNASSKEVENYISALKRGYAIINEYGMLTSNHIVEIQSVLEKNKAGFRSVPGTSLKNQKTGEIIYEPPQHPDIIKDLMANLEQFINDEEMSDYDPIIKMAIIHFQFESIHPFYDGNGRTGRIINVLYLVLSGLLEMPILYLSRYVIQNKDQYYKAIQEVRDKGKWEEWLMYMTKAVEETSKESLRLINLIDKEMHMMKNLLREKYKKMYSHEFLNHLFKHPYTKIEFLEKELGITRPTASGYLNKLAKDGILEKKSMGKSFYFINKSLVRVLSK